MGTVLMLPAGPVPPPVLMLPAPRPKKYVVGVWFVRGKEKLPLSGVEWHEDGLWFGNNGAKAHYPCEFVRRLLTAGRLQIEGERPEWCVPEQPKTQRTEAWQHAEKQGEKLVALYSNRYDWKTDTIRERVA